MKQDGPRVKTVYLDPWYGGKEPSSLLAKKKYGKDIPLAAAQKLQGLLEADGFEVLLLRAADQAAASEHHLLQGRSLRAVMQVILTVGLSKKDGVRIFYASPAGNKTPSVSETRSLLLARTIAKNLKTTPLHNRIELKTARDYILKNAQAPTVIINFRAASDPDKRSLINDEKFFNKITRSLVGSIKEYFAERAPKGNQ